MRTSFWCTQLSQSPAGTRLTDAAMTEARQVLVVLRHALLDRVAVGAAVDEAPHRVGDLLGASRAWRGSRISSTSASSSRSIFCSAVPSPSAGNGTPRRFSSQAPLTIANRLRREIASSDMRCASLAHSPGGAHVSCLRSEHVLPSARLPAPVPRGRRLVARARRARDGRDGRDPVADRPRRSTRSTRGDRGDAAAVAALIVRRRAAAPRAVGGAPAGRGARVARRRARPAQPRLRAPAGARAGVLRAPADRPADVARDGRPAGRALLPRLRPGVHRPERADDPAGGGRDVRAAARAGRARAGAGAVRGRWSPARYGRRSRPALQEVQQRIAELTADVEENVSGVRVVKAFAAEERQLERFRGTRRARVRPVDDRDAAARVLQPVHRLPAEPRARGGPARRRPPGDRRHAHARRLHRVLRLPADADRADAPARRRARAGPARDRLGRAAVRAARPRAADRRRRRARRRCPPGRGRVELRGVSFAYEGARAPALRDIDLDVEAGTTVALVGATGSGKTTLVQLLAAAVRRRPRARC